MTITIGCDHAGVDLKKEIIHQINKEHEVFDVGTHNTESVDYPDIAHKAINRLLDKKAQRVILLCGSGNGINMTANKHHGVRSALCWTKEIAELARQHNDANTIALPARYLNNEEAIEIVLAFLSVEFEGGRHLNRVNKINCA
jgi:ribose 5-phosphate isomerase B